jgi:hypothetical protein
MTSSKEDNKTVSPESEQFFIFSDGPSRNRIISKRLEMLFEAGRKTLAMSGAEGLLIRII